MSEQEYHKYGRAALLDELRQKVTKGLECCRRGFCFASPYNDGIDENTDCKQQWADDALALLKAQQPRVMTLEEVKRAEQDGEPLWIELLLYDRSNGWYMGRTVICSTLPPRHIMERNMERNQSRLVLTDTTYAKFWRCWTARPSKAEMEEAPW